MKSFFAQLKGSLSKSPLYQSPENNSLGRAFGYIAILVAAIALVKAVAFGIAFAPAVGALKDLAAQSIQKFPADLTLTLSKGVLSMNKPSPFILPSEAKKGDNKPAHRNAVVIDTEKSLSLETYQSYDTDVLVGSAGYMAKNGRGGVQLQTFGSLPDTVLTKEKVDSYYARFAGFVDSFSALGVVVLTVFVWIILSALSYVGALFLSLLGVLVALAVTRIKGHQLPFSRLYALSLYAYTIVALLGLIKMFLGFSSWISLLAFVLILALFVSDRRAPGSTASAA
ncbi:MAG TPA: DUF1189 family protein [Candidatus Paceibacterota bacterium]|nr:DUF1189 family protein [Candidatus Paceibacterota bacterium]